ncbi:LptE family protein [Rhodosalinus sediminis]|uniref:LptE family protein n=1 Tax=Rhodosalinus sediminis TaxID=1940533 RepID=UPI0023534EEE|nr:LptE family protein [Rhodosalinus sediminis]
MWCSDRRRLLALSAAALAAGCGFAPVYGPGGAGRALQGQVAVPAPDTRLGYHFTRRLEARLGRAEAPRYRLEAPLTVEREGLGTTADGRTTRYQLIGRADWRLRPAAPGAEPVAEGRVRGFTGYSSTGSPLAARAAERDAEERLATLLADRLVERLLMSDIGAAAP